MARIASQIAPGSPEFAANAARMQALIAETAALAEQTMRGGDAKSRDRHVARGKLLPRDRVARLLDPGSPFLEIGLFAAHGVYDSVIPAAGVVAGIGRVSGRDCMILSNDATVKGGTYYPLTVKKHLRAQEVALHNHCLLYTSDAADE